MVDSYELISQMKEYAMEHDIPIMHDDGISYLVKYIQDGDINSVLEIGTAIGYSAIMMALSDPNLKITTIERDEKRYLEAVKNVKKAQLEDRITLIYSDAFDVDIEEEFDLIFIDAAKAQNIKFFEMFSKNLTSTGTIITDNMNFHGLVDTNLEEISSRNVRGLVRKIQDYIAYLKSNKLFKTEFLDIGDGLAISTRN